MHKLPLPLLAALIVSALPALAQGGAAAEAEEELTVFAFTLEHQRAAEALALVQPLLSRRGTVELNLGDNTLVVRDSLSALSQIAPVLRNFDHPARAVTMAILIVEASRAVYSPVIVDPELPGELAERLKELMPFSSYRVLARTRIRTREGEEVTYELSQGYGIRFRLGTMVERQRLKLYDFQVLRTAAGRAGEKLIHSNLNLSLDHPLALALARSEASHTALMVVLTPSMADAAAEADR